jgi:hypothetical protein
MQKPVKSGSGIGKNAAHRILYLLFRSFRMLAMQESRFVPSQRPAPLAGGPPPLFRRHAAKHL